MPKQPADPTLPLQRRWTRRKWVLVCIAVALLWSVAAIGVAGIAETNASASQVHHRGRFTVPIVQTRSGYFVPLFEENAQLLLQWWFPYRHHHAGWFDVAEGDGFVVIGSTEAAPSDGLRDPDALRRTAHDWVIASAPNYVPRSAAASILRTSPESHRILWLGLFLNGSILLVIIGIGAMILVAPLFAVPVLRRIRRRRRIRRNHCPHCAYDLSATPGALCPECGGANPFTAP